MEEHVEKDEVVSMKEYEKTEKVLNATAIALSRILGLGANYGQEGRVKETVVVLNSHPPDLYGLRKDHKEQKDKVEVSEDVRKEVGEAINPANCPENKRNVVGGELDLANNPIVQLRLNNEEIRGKSNPELNHPKNSVYVRDYLENNQNKKEFKKIKKGPKLRPVVGANKASSRPTSHILSKVIYKLCEIIGRTSKTNCESTEEMIAEIENVNKGIEENEDIVIGSLDIIKWYPSMKIKRLLEIIMELIMETNLDLREIDLTI